MKRKTLVSIAKTRKEFSPEKFNYCSKDVMRAGQQREAASHGLGFFFLAF